MLRTLGPSVLLGHAVGELLRQHPHIREGTEEGFHQARVAIRRIREALVVARGDYQQEALGGIEARLREAAQVLGRARDADVAQRLIHHMETRFPFASSTLGSLRASVAADQLNARRRAIKKLETLDLPSLPDVLHRARRAGRWGPSRTNWRAVLRQHMIARAEAVRGAIEHAGGVYFPNRVHSARVRIKQLRYTLELAKATHTWRMPHAIRVLKRAQAALGDAHDRELLAARIDALGVEAPRNDAIALQQFLWAEAQAQHASYLACRSNILGICDSCERVGRRIGVGTGSLLVASLAVPSLLLLRNASERRQAEEEVVERRISIGTY